MTKGSVGIGIVGVGLMGRLFAEIAAGLPDVELIAVTDTNAAAAAAVSHQFQCRVTDSAAEMAELDEVQGVVIATPEDQHVQSAIDFLQRDKSVLIEKPLAVDAIEGRKILEAGGANSFRVAVGHVLRLDPAYGMAREAVRAGDIGDVVHTWVKRNTSVGDADRLRGRTSIVDYLGIHDIDALHWVTGQRIVNVTAYSVRNRMGTQGVDDAVQALLRFENGAIGTLECSWLRPNEASGSWGSAMSVWGTKGVIEVTPYATGFAIAAGGKSSGANQTYLTKVGPHGVMTGIYRDELSNFVESVRGRHTAACSGQEGLAAVCVADAIKESLTTGSTVDVAK
jgi:predicted dehydrogenase